MPPACYALLVIRLDVYGELARRKDGRIRRGGHSAQPTRSARTARALHSLVYLADKRETRL